jgi:hypothetical protein
MVSVSPQALEVGQDVLSGALVNDPSLVQHNEAVEQVKHFRGGLLE